MKATRLAANKSGTQYAIVRESEVRAGGPDDLFSVWVERSNYSRHARGGIEKTWRTCARSLQIAEAEKLFFRRLKGTLR